MDSAPACTWRTLVPDHRYKPIRRTGFHRPGKGSARRSGRPLHRQSSQHGRAPQPIENEPQINADELKSKKVARTRSGNRVRYCHWFGDFTNVSERARSGQSVVLPATYFNIAAR